MRRSSTLRNAAAIAAASFTALLLPGCASAPGDGGPPNGDAPAGDVTLDAISPRSGDPGTGVTVRASGFAAGEAVEIGFGPPRSEYDVVARVTAGSDGNVTTTVQVPSWAEEGRSYVFVVADADTDRKAVSSSFHVTTAEGRVRVTGRITDEGVECTALRSEPDNQLYTLAGDTGGLEPGDRVTVEGTIAEVSFCQQGTTIDVAEIQRR